LCSSGHGGYLRRAKVYPDNNLGAQRRGHLGKWDVLEEPSYL
jgi:hypothetical protein